MARFDLRWNGEAFALVFCRDVRVDGSLSAAVSSVAGAGSRSVCVVLLTLLSPSKGTPTELACQSCSAFLEFARTLSSSFAGHSAAVAIEMESIITAWRARYWRPCERDVGYPTAPPWWGRKNVREELPFQVTLPVEVFGHRALLHRRRALQYQNHISGMGSWMFHHHFDPPPSWSRGNSLLKSPV
jgi:hypothetical protein